MSACGDILESVFYDIESSEITESSTPLFYVTGTKTVNLKTDDDSLINTSSTYKVKVVLADYPTKVKDESTGDINFVTPCTEPDALTFTGQGGATPSFNYNYDNSVQPVVAPEFTATP